MKIHRFAFYLCVLAALEHGQRTWAASPPITISNTPASRSPAILTISDILSELKNPPKKLTTAEQTLKKTLKPTKKPKSMSALRSIRSDKTYGDYARILLADEEIQNLESDLLKNKFESVKARAQKLQLELVQSVIQFPVSPAFRGVSERVSRLRLTAARAAWGLKDVKFAKQEFENAFVFYRDEKKVTVIPLPNFDQYARVCVKGLKQGQLLSESCQYWLGYFLTVLPERSNERKAILSVVPDLQPVKRTKWEGPRRSESYRTSSDPDLDTMTEGINQLLKNNLSEARSSLEELVSKYPKSVMIPRALFWLGKIEQKERQVKKSEMYFNKLLNESPLTYYGVLAGLELGVPVEEKIDPNGPRASTSDPSLDPLEKSRLERAERFIRLGLNDFAKVELSKWSRTSSLSSEFLVYLAGIQSSLGNILESYSLLTELLQREYPGMNSEFSLGIVFSGMWADRIFQAVKDVGVDPVLMLSLIKQESGFSPDIVSSSGAIGLSQLMNFTAIDVNPKVELSELTQPDLNVQIGAQYLKKLIDDFGGNVIFALAAYNAGPERAKRWIADRSSSWGPLEFIESISYKETREYVASIFRNYYWYSRRLKSEKPDPRAIFWPKK